MISRCGYALHFPDDLMLNIFHVCVGDLYVFFGKMSIQILCPLLTGLFALLMLSCMSSLYILDINPLLDLLLGNIFSYSVGCLFILLMVSFGM